MVKGRVDIFKKLSKDFEGNTMPVAWIHCASLGEFEQGRPVVEAFAEQFPNFKIVLTFFSPSGYEIRKNYDKAHVVSYLPFDTFNNSTRFIELVKPKIAIFVKYEFWNNYLTLLHQNRIPVFLISANFRSDQLFFKSYAGFFRKILMNFDYIFVQNERSKKLLQSIDFKDISIVGDTRFDRVFNLSKTAISLKIISDFKGKSMLFVLGSAWEEDFNFLIPLFNDETIDFKIVIAPHEINANQIKAWQTKLKQSSIKYSEINEDEVGLLNSKILFIDNIGLLSSIYKYADYCWIGGAFGNGLHNILEAAAFGSPIFFGNKKYEKFEEAVDLIKLKGAFSFEKYVDFQNKIFELMDNENYYSETCKIAKYFVESHIGATDKIMKVIKESLPDTK